MIKSTETERLISRTDDLVRYAEKHGSAVSGFFDAASVKVLSENICPVSDSQRAGCLTVFSADMPGLSGRCS